MLKSPRPVFIVTVHRVKPQQRIILQIFSKICMEGLLKIGQRI